MYKQTAAQPTATVARLAQTGTPRAAALAPLADAFAVLAAALPFDRNVEIFGEGEPAEYLYQVVSGAVRTYKVLEDGRRQIGAFYLPGDVFGLEAGDTHGFSAEAIVRSTVRLAKRSAVAGMAARDSELAAALLECATHGLRAAHEHLMVLGRKNAEERVATFLLDMARRESARDIIELPMSRQDIADYLGLTIETISRTFTQLETEAAIELPTSRRVVVRRPSRLQQLDA
jgi:CRP-like cAMP-binding protein